MLYVTQCYGVNYAEVNHVLCHRVLRCTHFLGHRVLRDLTMLWVTEYLEVTVLHENISGMKFSFIFVGRTKNENFMQ